MTADQIKKGQTVILESITASPLTLNFMEMGIMPGKKLTLMRKAPLNGPMAFLIEGNIIALRVKEAKLLNVSQN